jgi:hypothetical protein
MNSGRLLMPAINWLWMQNNRFEFRRFLNSLEGPGSAQEQYLKKLLKTCAATDYGRKYHFSQISSVLNFQENVPLTHYEDYLPYIEDISHGKTNVLTHEPVILFQPTSGTSSPSKLIPYTRSLKAEYQRGIAPWIYSLYSRVPAIMQGKAYWSISPSIGLNKAHGCIPVGFDDDSEYLGMIGKRLFQMVSVGPQQFAPHISADTFWTQTLTNLLASCNLTLISIWSPTFLLILCRRFIDNWAELLEILKKRGFPASRIRAGEIEKIIQNQGFIFEAIWPDLKLISCWTHGASESYIPEIRRYFPHVEIQGKGLISTEAFVSFPLFPEKDPVLAVNTHFYEFRDVVTGEIWLANELKQDCIYSVIVTTGGGLYRYELDDLVRITGFITGTPALRFISKNAVSDLCGEKLHIEHIQRSFTQALSEVSVANPFWLLAPVELTSQKLAYALFIHSPVLSDDQGKILRDKLEMQLRQNFHYAHCRDMNQLEPLKVFFIDGSSAAPESVYTEELARRGQKLGDIKFSILDCKSGWEKRFPGRFLDIDGL